jgi:hypothetical protein
MCRSPIEIIKAGGLKANQRARTLNNANPRKIT